MLSILCRFQSSAHASLFAIRRVVDSSSVSMISSPMRPERAAGLGALDNRVNQLRHLHLGRAPTELDVHVHAVALEVALGDLYKLRRDAFALQVLRPSDRRVLGNRQHPLERLRGRLGIDQLADLVNVGVAFQDVIISRDADIQHPRLHVARDLLRPQKRGLDLVVIHARVIRPRPDPKIPARLLEQRERGFLQASLGQCDFELQCVMLLGRPRSEVGGQNLRPVTSTLYPERRGGVKSNGEWRTANGEWGTGNGERRMGNGEHHPASPE